VRNFKSEEWLGGSLQHRTNMLFSTFNDLNTSLRLPKLVSLTSKNASFFADGSSEIGQYRINIDTDFFKPGKEQELAELGSHEVTHGSDQDYVVARLIADRLAMGRVPAARQLQQFSDDFSNFMFTKPTPRFVINTMVAREGQQLSAPEIDRAERLIASHQNQALFIIKDQILGDIEPAIEASIYKLSEGYPCWKWLAEAMAPLAVPTENVVTRIATFTPGVIPVARAAGVRVELLQATPQQLLGQMPEIQRLASQVRRDSNGNPIPWAGRGFADDKPTGIELTVLEKLETALMNRLTVIRKAPKLGFGTLFDREYADRFHESEAIQTGVTIGNIVGEILSGKILPKPSSSPPSR
jgi:hypothetical protein